MALRHLNWVLRGLTRLIGWLDENKESLSPVEREKISTGLFIVLGEFYAIYRDRGIVNQDLIRLLDHVGEVR